MVTVLVRHRVGAYESWKKVYDQHAGMREAMGTLASSVYRDTADPEVVVVAQRFPNMQTASHFASSEDLKVAMGKAGVVGHPEIWFLEDVEHTQS